MKSQVNKNKKKKLKKSYIQLLVLVFFLILIIVFTIINNSSDYENDYVSEYKDEKPAVDNQKSLFNKDTIDAAEGFTNVVLKTVPIAIGILLVIQMARIFIGFGRSDL